MAQSKQMTMRALLGFTSAGLALGLMSGCDTEPPKSVWETKVAYADSIVRGFEVGTKWTIAAARFDDRTGVLMDVQLDDGYGRYFVAERAEILVDPASDSVALRLVEVLEASSPYTGDSKEYGLLTEHDEITTSPVRMPFDIVP